MDRFRIDQHRLDEEWQGQPDRYHSAAVFLADAKMEYEQAKARRDVVEAEVNLDIRRREPADFGVKSLTEDVVKKCVVLDKRYQKAVHEVHDTQRAMGIAQADVDAEDQRKAALQDIVRLFLADYWGTSPRVPESKVAFPTKKRNQE